MSEEMPIVSKYVIIRMFKKGKRDNETGLILSHNKSDFVVERNSETKEFTVVPVTFPYNPEYLINISSKSSFSKAMFAIREFLLKDGNEGEFDITFRS